MKNSQDEYEAFMQKVHEWERQKNENLAGRVKSKNADTEAIGRQTDSFQTKECLGYFWSQYLLKKHGKKQPRKQDMQVIMHKGVPVRGIVLDEEHGKPRGVIELSSISEKALDQVTSLGKASEMVHPDGEEAAMEHLVGSARRRLNVRCKEKNVDKTDIIQLQTGEQKRRRNGSSGKDSSDSETMIDGIWGQVVLPGAKKKAASSKSGSNISKKAKKNEEE